MNSTVRYSIGNLNLGFPYFRSTAMKILIPFSLIIISSLNCFAEAVHWPTQFGPSVYTKENAAIDVDAFLALTPKKVKEQTGRRLTIKQALALKAAQKKIKKGLANDNDRAGDKSQVTALILAIFLGWLGVHRFYLGYPAMGILMLVSLGGCFIMAIVDLVLIATGELKPKYGPYYDSLD